MQLIAPAGFWPRGQNPRRQQTTKLAPVTEPAGTERTEMARRSRDLPNYGKLQTLEARQIKGNSV